MPSRVIDDSREWEEILNIDLKFGGSFLLSDDISSRQLPAVLHLFATTVRFNLKGKHHTDWKADGAVYQAIPEIFIKFASGCQFDSDYRLMRRCLLTASVSQ